MKFLWSDSKDCRPIYWRRNEIVEMSKGLGAHGVRFVRLCFSSKQSEFIIIGILLHVCDAQNIRVLRLI